MEELKFDEFILNYVNSLVPHFPSSLIVLGTIPNKKVKNSTKSSYYKRS